VVEMRWLERWASRRSARIAAAKAGIEPKKIRTLQYRVFQQGILMTPEGEQPVHRWSDWIDVPIIEEMDL
jgi:hypothetical protein